MRLPFSSLRSKLIAAFVAVMALSLMLTIGSYGVITREYHADRERERLSQVARSTSMQVFQAQRSDVSLSEIVSQVDQLASASGSRILLLTDRNQILRDTEENRLLDYQLPLPSNRPRAGLFQGIIEIPTGEQVFVAVPFGPPSGGLRVAVITPEHVLANAWLALLPSLFLVALGCLAISVAAAWWIASSITRPLRQITRATEEIARGNYDHELAVAESRDEVGRLARAFSLMVREVARSHRAMRDLLANVSHDLRTPLTSIQGFAGALVDGTLNGQQGAHEAGRVIGEEAGRMRRLVEDLLDLGRIESGEAQLDRSSIDLAELTIAAHVRFTFRAEQASVQLSIEAPLPVYVLGDAYRLSQVLDNLLENAVYHTPPNGAVNLRLDVLPPPLGQPREGQYAVLTVQNTGSLIPSDELERVFERFYQVDRSRVAKVGRGLGLAIAREIVQAHGGTLVAASNVHDGTTFTLSLPILELPAGPQLISPHPSRLRPLAAGTAATRR